MIRLGGSLVQRLEQDFGAGENPILNKIRAFLNSSFLEKGEYLEELYWALKAQVLYRRCFGQLGSGSRLLDPMRLTNVQNIYIGNGVRINKHAFLLTLKLPRGPVPRLTIEDGCTIGHLNHITCVDKVKIGRRVLTADRVHISDNSHTFLDPGVAIRDQGITSSGPVHIGEGSWIGEGASILSCTIGRNCVVGSNAVVLGNIPDFCVVAGVPARILRRFDATSGSWNRIGLDQERC
ncbi:MAG TPA: acyltransferase [Acidobacteriaceae bacterium]|nr:acyltransferase [Acidobacteriaceae bacterium]